MNPFFLLLFLTDDLEAAVVTDLSDVSGAEPPLAVPVHSEILPLHVFTLVVAHGDVGPTDQDLPSGMWPVRAVVATLEHKTEFLLFFSFLFR